MRTVHLTLLTGLLAGLAATVLLLAAVHATVGLGDMGWAVGLLVALIMNALLTSGLDRAGATALGTANAVTLARGTLVAGVAALVVGSFLSPADPAAIVALCVPALLLDAVDGAVARRTGTVTAVGARFDMEVDAFLLLVLSVFVARSAGPWVLAIGIARYAFVLAGYLLPWMRAQLPPRYWRKVVAASAGVVLTFAASGVGGAAVTTILLLGTVALIAESFGRDVFWLWARRPAGLPGSTGAVGPIGLPPIHSAPTGPALTGPAPTDSAVVDPGRPMAVPR